ncbi:glycosyltransferase family 4 protein [Tolypothrix campylonemoides VB511288]|nr:glycosyltransferase family 4 protein [Tolypothrix campylonemoides VB511288]
MNKSCSIFFYEGYVDVAPTIINLAKSLSNCGYFVTIYAKENECSKPQEMGKQIEIVYFKHAYQFSLLSILIKTLNQIRLSSLVTVIETILFLYQCLFHILFNSKKLENNISVGIDTYGSITAFIKSLLTKQKFIYLSLELTEPKHFRRFSKVIKVLERLAYRNSEGIIVQDRDRFDTLCSYNNYQHPKVFYLPNAASTSDSVIQLKTSENYFRKMFNLSIEDFPNIVIQAGMISDLMLSQLLAQAFAPIKRCALIFHERIKREIDDPYIRRLQEINSTNLFFSLSPLPYEQIDKIYASATIGLAFYTDIDNNFSQIAMASGKLSHYLKHGKPVLVNNLESLSRLVEKYQIGVVIQEPSNSLEMELAIQKIMDNYEFYSKNAKICFEEEFDFAKKVQPVLSLMANL